MWAQLIITVADNTLEIIRDFNRVQKSAKKRHFLASIIIMSTPSHRAILVEETSSEKQESI